MERLKAINELKTFLYHRELDVEVLKTCPKDMIDKKLHSACVRAYHREEGRNI